MSRSERSQHSTEQSPEPSVRKRPVSERKIQANRRNALRSTGPKTQRGKRIVGLNAVKHGILAREVPITSGDGEESQEDFHALIERLWEHYQPVGVIEEMLVEKIGTSWWRQGRVLRAENGMIRKRVDTARMDRLLRDSDKANLALMLSNTELSLYRAGNPTDAKVSTIDRWSTIQTIQTDLRGHGEGLEALGAILYLAKSQLLDTGYISHNLGKVIFGAFGTWDYTFAFACVLAGPSKANTEGTSSEKAVHTETDQCLLTFIESRIERIDLLREYAIENEKIRQDVEARSFSLPPTDQTEKLLRYESSLDKQLYRAMDQLERLQRQRKGENVPPPLNVNLGRRS